MKIKLVQDPYEKGDVVFNYSNLIIQPGVTILVGRNGAGKSTLLHQISKYCKKENIRCFEYDNYKEGSDNARSKYSYFGDFKSLGVTLQQSEGQQIFYNFGQICKQLGRYASETETDKPLVILLDAMDSGLDLDGIDQVLDLYKTIQGERKGETYYILTANNYGLIHNQNCIDVTTGKEIRFDSFEDFSKFIHKQYEVLRNPKIKPKSKPRRLK